MRRNTDPGKNNSFVQMIRQAEEIWNDYKGLEYSNPRYSKSKIAQLEKKVQKLNEINWKQEFDYLKNCIDKPS